jgi:CRISPR-associated endonuclease/helicase Cas3
MPKIDEATRQQRLDRISLLLMRNIRGLTEGEIADEVQIDRRTVNNYLRELDYQGKAYKDGIYWFPLVLKDSRLRPFDLSPEEAVTLYLGARLLSKQQDKRNEPAETALLKLASVLKADAGVGAEIEQAARELAQRPIQKEYQPVFRDVVRGYIYRKKIEIAYRPLSWNKSFQTTFSTYLLEPSPIGFTTYLIGHSSRVNALRAYKLERIESIRLTREEYSIPPDFPGLDILRNAWSIVMGDETVRVVLRFDQRVKARVLETRWHPSQQTRNDSEKPGSLLWEVQVADTLDLLPWIRSWGADVEVLEPKELRTALGREAQALAELYQGMETQAKQMVYYAHSRKGEDKSNWQLLIDHLIRTADLAEKFGTDAGVSELARIAGLMHDIGKYSKEFQARLNGSPQKVDHATAGAKEVQALFDTDQNQKYLADMLAYCIAGHHTGLPDYGSHMDVDGDGTLLARVEKKALKEYSAYKSESRLTDLHVPARIRIKADKKHPEFSFAFFTRMIFSALVDADFQDTETYVNRGEKPRGGYASIEELCETFNSAIRKFDNPQGEINKKRTETLKACVKQAELDQGFFTLTIPTGGGKTLASMAFALNHAVKHGLKRIIYVIPFTSIIEQNAAVFKDYLGEMNVLEHHSNFDWKMGNKTDTDEADDETKDALDKLKLASENWDIPIVVTTNVQFFESLFANKSSRCRKLHNIARSVIIFDEAQMLPREYLDPCMLAVKELVRNYGVSAIFCTATQPALNRRLPDVSFTELARDPQALFDFYKRVLITNLGRTADAELIETIRTYPQVLCIVNTRRHARGLFGQLEGKGNFHLSTLMCPKHRKEVLAMVRDRLKTGQTCRVISTQVMEAGIDVDFPVGFRALAGLDSILQAAGRVNREMKRGISDLFVFSPDTPFIRKTPEFVKQGAAVAESILRDFARQPDSKEAIDRYFDFLYDLQGRNAFDVRSILSHFSNGLEFDFRTAAENFRMIDNNTVAVLIPYNEEARNLLKQAQYHPYPYTFARQLQMYTVNIYENEFRKLQSKGVIETINDTYEALTENSMTNFYHEMTGLTLPADAGGDAVFFD